MEGGTCICKSLKVRMCGGGDGVRREGENASWKVRV